MLKIINVLFISIIFCNYSFGQRLTIKNIESRLITNQGVEFVGELKDKSEDIFLFSSWSNNGVLVVEDKIFQLNNINFDITTNSIVSRINRDELFMYKSLAIDSFKINKRSFKKVGNIFYEVLFEKGNHKFLKKHDIHYEKENEGRYGGAISKAKVSLTYKYLIVSDDDFKRIELNKKSIVDLFISKEDNLKSFVKKQRLSYKKEKDIIKMIDYMI